MQSWETARKDMTRMGYDKILSQSSLIIGKQFTNNGPIWSFNQRCPIATLNAFRVECLWFEGRILSVFSALKHQARS